MNASADGNWTVDSDVTADSPGVAPPLIYTGVAAPPPAKSSGIDIASVWDSDTQHCDYVIENGDFRFGNDVETAVLISLFTDRLAAANDVLVDARPGYPGDRRGWWADDPEHPMGSRLWLLNRVKGPLDVAAKAQEYAAEALQWMLDDGVVARFDIQAQWIPPKQLSLLVVAYRSNGTMISNQSLSLW